MHALFLALEFPPLNNTGVHRSAKLAKYLPEFGIDPVVLTLHANDAAAAFGAPLEPSLMEELPSDLALFAFHVPPERPRATRLGRFLRIWTRTQDPFATGIQPALLRALPEIAGRYRPSVVYVSMPPFSAGGLALSVARKLRLPLVVDMRDGWSHWCPGGFPTYAHWALLYARERRLFERASAVVTVTPQLADIFRRSHPHIPAGRFHVVPNGYDGALELPAVLDVPRRDPGGPVTIGYVGGFYYSPEGRASAFTPWWRRAGHRKLHYHPVREDWLYRSPYFFFRALRELRRRDPALGTRIRFALIGEKPVWFDAMVREHELDGVVDCYGRIPQARVLEVVRSLDAQLCTSVKVEGGEDYALASKTFDYVRGGRPILGLVTRGSQREFLERSGMALIADPDDLEASVSALTRLARGDFQLRPDQPFIETYHRRAVADRMAQVLRSAASDSTATVARDSTRRPVP